MSHAGDLFGAQRARFMRPDAARWLRSDAARWLRPRHPDELKYSRDQTRVPAGNGIESGRWTDGGGGSGASSGSLQSDEFSSDRPGWHDYQGENLLCPADLFCSSKEIADQLARLSVPGRDPSMPAEN